jgi:hypothetical protein
MSIDLTDNHRPCPVCRRVLTDQPLCLYCQTTANLQKDVFAANMRAVRLQVLLDFLAGAATSVVNRWDSTDWKNTEHTGVYIAQLRAAVANIEKDPSQPVKPRSSATKSPMLMDALRRGTTEDETT